MSEEDQFLAITASNIRTARWYLLQANNVLNDAILLFFENGDDGVPGDFMPELLHQNENLEDSNTEEEEIEAPAPLTLPLPSEELLKEVGPMIKAEKPPVEHLPINLKHKQEISVNSSNITIKKPYHQNPSLLLGFMLCDPPENTESPSLEIPIVSKRYFEKRSVELILYKNGYSIDSQFIPLDQTQLKKLVDQIQCGKFVVKGDDIADISIRDQRNVDHM